MRPLRELLSDDPAWPYVQEWIADATKPVEVLPASEPDRSIALETMQVTTRSPMGAVVYETGGIVVDGGWLRILGSGHPRMPRSLPGGNKGRTWEEGQSAPPLLYVADDVVGGVFALDGGALGGPPGHVHYFAPDRLEWESLERGYSDFLAWALQGDLGAFYESLRWPGWRDEVAKLSGDQGISIYPFLWAAGPPVEDRARKVAPIAEIVVMQFDVRRQMDDGNEA